MRERERGGGEDEAAAVVESLVVLGHGRGGSGAYMGCWA